ncbi:MAG: hypothetical protein H0W73_18720 [Bacteroidetes bacterium]|nr:hypothetical protein [Bacteroidota bacterium]
MNNSLSYSGYCNACKKEHSLPPQKAIEICDQLIKKFKIQQCIDDGKDPRLSTQHLYTEIGGKMFGVLICEDTSGNEIILKAFSSTYNGIWNVEGWVPHLVNEADFMKIVKAGDTEIHPLTALIPTLEKKSEEWLLKTNARKLISQKILIRLQGLYTLTNFKKENKQLSHFFAKGIPNGTGDCCAPKLLNYAAANNLKPISIAEFYWGKASPSGDKVEGQFYSSCTDKCQPILGFMMCGI